MVLFALVLFWWCLSRQTLNYCLSVHLSHESYQPTETKPQHRNQSTTNCGGKRDKPEEYDVVTEPADIAFVAQDPASGWRDTSEWETQHNLVFTLHLEADASEGQHKRLRVDCSSAVPMRQTYFPCEYYPTTTSTTIKKTTAQLRNRSIGLCPSPAATSNTLITFAIR